MNEPLSYKKALGVVIDLFTLNRQYDENERKSIERWARLPLELREEISEKRCNKEDIENKLKKEQDDLAKSFKRIEKLNKILNLIKEMENNPETI